MFSNVFFLSVLLLLVNQTSAFNIQAGNISLIEGKFDLAAVGNRSNESIKIMRRMSLFPYDIFQCEVEGSFFNYILLKKSLQDIQSLLPESNLTNQLKDKLLYDIIPQVIQIFSDHNQYLSLNLLDADFENKKIIIKNGTIQTNGQLGESMSLYIYSLQIHNYLFKTMTKVQRMAKQDLKKLEQSETESTLTLESQQNPILTFNLTQQAKKSEEDIIRKIIKEEVLTGDQTFERIQSPKLVLQKIMTRSIKKNTKYKGFFDGFSLHFVSATISEQNNSQPILQIVHLIKRGGETKRQQLVTESLKFTNLKSIQFLDLCIKQAETTLIISDKHKGYVLDISNLQWHLVKYISHYEEGYKSIFFNDECEVFGVDILSKQVRPKQNLTEEVIPPIIYTRMTQLYPFQTQNLWEIPQKLQTIYSFQNRSFLFCFSEKEECFISSSPALSHNQSSIIVPLSSRKLSQIELKHLIDGSNITIVIEVYEPSQNKQELIVLDSVSLIEHDNSTKIKGFLFNWDIYLNKTKFVNYQMDLAIFDRTKSSLYQSVLTQQQLFGQLFDEQHDSHCVSQQLISLSQTKLQFNQTQPWSVCTLNTATSTYLSLRFVFENIVVRGYKLYMCSFYLYQNSDSVYIDCSSLLENIPTTIDSQELNEGLRSNYFYKVYLIKQSPLEPTEYNSTGLPILYVKDVERQQIEIASTIFFFIMLSLSLVLVTLIFFILLKNIVYNVLVYYGHINERREPTYPLAWFPLKIKLKRMQQIGILKFTEYQPSLNDTEGNHCCFCLELLNIRCKVAEMYCGHQFHKSCFSDWIKNEPNVKCPTCRRPFTAAGLAEYQIRSGSEQELPLYDS